MPDALVIGSGPVGAVAARRLAEGGLDVVVLERGAPISDPPGTHVRNQQRFQRDPDSYLASIVEHFDYFDLSAPPAGLPGACSTAGVGGQGVLWTNNCPRPVPGVELDETIDADEWDRYLAIAEQHLGVRSDQFVASVRQREIAERLRDPLGAQDRVIRPQPMAGSVTDGGDIHYIATADVLEPVAGLTGSVAIEHGDVERLTHRSGRPAVELVDGRSLDARLVVLAAGAFGTPMLLHRSGIRPPALGRHLTYHAVLVTQVVLAESSCAPPGVHDLPPRLMIPPTTSHPWHTMILRDINPFPPTEPDLEVPENRVVEIQSFCPIDIVETNAMAITDDGAVSFDVPLTEADRARMDDVRQDVDTLAATLGRYRAGAEPQWMDLGFAHVMGTCRMGSDAATSVVDPVGRLRGVDDVYLVGVGVIPHRLAVNPTLTAAALAVRSMDHASPGVR